MTVVGTVAATDDGGNACLTYDIRAGNEDGLFAIGDEQRRSHGGWRT